jgi:hypothetical protein
LIGNAIQHKVKVWYPSKAWSKDGLHKPSMNCPKNSNLLPLIFIWPMIFFLFIWQHEL